jgi:acetylornithine deacetylase/succinyl-diaminopimelate desuccinylase-like protein
MRLAPGMRPARALANLRAHLETHVPEGVSLTMSPERGGTPAPTLPDEHPVLLAASRVQARLHGQEAVAVRSGGTLPISAIFRELLGLDTLAYGRACAERIFSPVIVR